MIGWYAGNAITNNLSTFIGHQAGKNATAGACVAIGADTMVANATAAYSVAIGFETLTALTSGANNTIVGGEAARALTTGQDNVGLGYRVLNSTTSSYNTAIGTKAFSIDTNSSKEAPAQNALSPPLFRIITFTSSLFPASVIVFVRRDSKCPGNELDCG